MKQPKEINLIPESERAFSFTKVIPFLAVFAIIIVIVFVFGIFTVFQKMSSEAKAKDLEETLRQTNVNWKKVATSAAQVGAIKSKLTSYEVFKKTFPTPNAYIKTIKDLLPSTAKLTLLEIDNLGNTTLQAKVPTAADAYELFNQLNKEKTFVNLKIVSLVKDAAGNFYTVSYTLQIK